jgi:hypothetical protein
MPAALLSLERRQPCFNSIIVALFLIIPMKKFKFFVDTLR